MGPVLSDSLEASCRLGDYQSPRRLAASAATATAGIYSAIVAVGIGIGINVGALPGRPSLTGDPLKNRPNSTAAVVPLGRISRSIVGWSIRPIAGWSIRPIAGWSIRCRCSGSCVSCLLGANGSPSVVFSLLTASWIGIRERNLRREQCHH